MKEFGIRLAGEESMNKSEKEFNMSFVKTYDVLTLSNLVANFNYEWLEDISRQDGSKHHWRTESYHIMWYPIGWMPGNTYVPSYLCKRDDVWNEINIILEDLSKIYNGKPARVTLVKLPPGKLVTPHADEQIYTHLINRFHIPILTNDDVMFSVMDETINMKTGECWEVNNAKIHGCYNLGKTDRVHLMVDIINDSFFGDEEYTGYYG